MSFFGFGRSSGKDPSNDDRRSHRWFGPPVSKREDWKRSQKQDRSSFSRTPRPDHRQSTGRTTGSSHRNDHRNRSDQRGPNRSSSQRRGMGGKRLY